uniref:DHC_N2 domain-containing protein n=1 Tax=Globodera pallida TaxID=36090 RepID=A0A183CGW0_GLOPA
MLLSSLLQNGTLANLNEWKKSCQKLKEWKESCQSYVMAVSYWHNKLTLGGNPELNQALIVLVNKVNEFSIEGMDEFFNRRLREPLAIAKSNCATLEYNNKERVIMKLKVELIAKTSCETWEEFETTDQKWEIFNTSRQKWEEWVNSCQLHVKTVSILHNKLTLDNLSIIADIYEALDALQKKGICKEFNTFSVEVELELINKQKGKKKRLTIKKNSSIMLRHAFMTQN